MGKLRHVAVEAMDAGRFAAVIAPAEHEALAELLQDYAGALAGRVIWNVNSTATGGGVVELLGPLLGCSRGAGVDARWVVITGGVEFFGITKRLHNHLHGFDGDGGALGEQERCSYEQTLAGYGAELAELVHPRDIVILHDPQTAGLLPAVRRTGAKVIWRCHVGMDRANDRAREAWSFLRPYLLDADAYVFSRAAFAWEGLPRERIWLIQPSIDAFSPKNADQSRQQTSAILSRSGIVPSRTGSPATFTRSDGTPGRVDRRTDMIEVEPLEPGDRLVMQISRWDRLKDPIGVLAGFARHVADRTDAHLLLAGPSTESVADDPEGADVFAAVREAWRALPADVRRRAHLAALPMDDVAENAAIVNALQRHATVVVQKSLAEGFGLTVAEAMWKERAVVASRIGGIQDQIVDGESGVLISDPRDLTEFAAAVVGLLCEPERARRMGAAAHLRVRDHFLGVHHLGRYFELIQALVDRAGGDTPAKVASRQA